MTEFKPILSCPGYQASACGQIKGRTGKILKGSLGLHGYLTFSFPIGGRGKAKRILIHRAVAEAWNIPGEGDCINHIDHNKLNNAVANLERCTRAENVQAATHFYGRPTATKYPREHDDLILELHNKGLSQRAISRAANCSRCRVRLVLGRYLP